MRKILLALKPSDPDRNTLDLACYLSKLTHAKVTGVFLDKEPLQLTVAPAETFLKQGDVSARDTKRSSIMERAIFHFKESCNCRETGYSLPIENAITVDDLIEESRFSDVLILPAGLSPGRGPQTVLSSIASYILSGANCPVVLQPGAFEYIDRIVFTYNGSKASVFAMHQFTYLFPEFCNTPVTVLAVNTGKDVLADKPALEEWLSGHYQHVEYNFSSGDTLEQLTNYLLPHRNAFVVMGAYGRKSLLRVLKRSTADSVSETLFNPLFIAHN